MNETCVQTLELEYVKDLVGKNEVSDFIDLIKVM